MNGRRNCRGFTLLEVLVALAILGLAVVSIMRLFSEGLRLLKLSGDHQHAVLLADQKAREVRPTRASTQSGQEGEYIWERKVEPVPMPDELTVVGAAPLRVFRVSVLVHWSGNRSVEVATLRTAREELPQ